MPWVLEASEGTLEESRGCWSCVRSHGLILTGEGAVAFGFGRCLRLATVSSRGECTSLELLDDVCSDPV